MKLIVGLGNPGTAYETTRHNAGFLALDAFYRRHADTFGGWQKKFHALVTSGVVHGEKVMLMKPLTFMNLSGDSVAPARGFYSIHPSDILVVSDEVHLPLGIARFREHGSAGGHNGIKSVIGVLGTQDFPRIRIGIGAERMGAVPMDAFVLERFTDEELDTLRPVMDTVSDMLEDYIQKGTEA